MGMIMLTECLQSVATFAREVHKLHFCSFHNNWKINLHIPSPAQKNKIEKEKSYSKDKKCKIIKQFPVREAKWYSNQFLSGKQFDFMHNNTKSRKLLDIHEIHKHVNIWITLSSMWSKMEFDKLSNSWRIPKMAFGPSWRRKSWACDAMHNTCNSSWGKIGIGITLQKNLLTKGENLNS